MIILMGLAGTGKSTQSQLLAKHLHCPWISTGGLLRQHMDESTQADILQGKIVDDNKTISVLSDEFARVGAAKNESILDGSPRTMRQAEWLAQQVEENKLFITAIIHLLASQETAKKRLLARRRPDDYEEAISERFKEYETSVLPILNFLRQRRFKIHEIDAEEPAEEVQAAIQKAIGAGKYAAKN